MTYFYARVSTKEQNLDRQIETADRFKRIDRIFSDKQSGKDFNREQYQLMKDTVAEGDEVVIKELDRLGRTKEGIKEEIKWFKEHKVTLRILDVPTTLIDFQDQVWISDMVNNILIEVLGSMAEQERNKIHVRQREGIDAMPKENGKRISKKTGKEYGRPKKEISNFQNILQKQKDGLLTVNECCRELGVSRSWWYSKVRKIGGAINL